jgi:hypothetical protein
MDAVRHSKIKAIKLREVMKEVNTGRHSTDIRSKPGSMSGGVGKLQDQGHERDGRWQVRQCIKLRELMKEVDTGRHSTY